MEREILLGKKEGARARRTQRIKYMDALLKQLGDGQRMVDLGTPAYD